MYPFRIKLYTGNIVDLADKVDVIVNAAKPSLEGGSGVDGAIHTAAGPNLLKKCKTISGTPNRCNPGSVVATDGFNLNCEIFHTVGSKIHSNHRFTQTQAKILRNCYKNCLLKCSECNFKTIAFPLIGSGRYNWDKNIAIRIAISEIHNYLLTNAGINTVYIVIYNEGDELLANNILEKHKFMNEKCVRSIALTAYESQKAYIADVRENKSHGFSLLYIARLLLVLYPFIYPISFLLRDLSGRRSWNARRSTIDLIVLAKIAIIIFLFVAPIHSDSLFLIKYVQPLVVAYLMIETILYNSSLLFLKDIQNSSASSERSILLFFFNLIELQLSFAYFYQFFCAVNGASSKMDYLYYAVTNNGEVINKYGLFLEIVQSSLFIYMTGILLAVFLSGIKSRDYIYK